MSRARRRASVAQSRCSWPGTGRRSWFTAATPRAAPRRSRKSLPLGGKASFVAADLGDVADVQRLASDIGDLDILINNAGIALFGPTAGFEVSAFDKMFASNVRAEH